MTTSPHILSTHSAPSIERAAIEVRWSATLATAVTRDRCVTFVLSLRPVDARHAVVECVVETASGVRTVVERRPVGCIIERDGPLLHIDARTDGRRIIALSYEPGPGGGTDCRLLYAQCAMLADAGFAAGGFDPPTASLRWPESDAAAG